MTEWYTIGQFSKMADVSTRTLRVYEDMGLIRSQLRGQNSYRYFQKNQLETLERIKSFKSFGFTLKEIRALLIADIGMNSEKLVTFLKGRLAALIETETIVREQRLRVEAAINILTRNNQQISELDKREVMKNFELATPVITVRDFVLFPGSKMSIFVGRPFSKAAVHIFNYSFSRNHFELKHGPMISLEIRVAYLAFHS
jgi:DNA-binding transcriptional MerR regulator